MYTVQPALSEAAVGYAERLVPGYGDALQGALQAVCSQAEDAIGCGYCPSAILHNAVHFARRISLEVLHLMAYSKHVNPRRTIEAQRFLEQELDYNLVRHDTYCTLVVDLKPSVPYVSQIEYITH